MPVTVRSKAEVCECSILRIASSILAEGMEVRPLCLLCVE